MPEQTGPLRLRVGRHWGHNLYEVHPDGSETPVGQALTPEMAARIVAAVNGAPVSTPGEPPEVRPESVWVCGAKPERPRCTSRNPHRGMSCFWRPTAPRSAIEPPPTLQPGWLREQVARSVSTFDRMPAAVRESLTQKGAD